MSQTALAVRMQELGFPAFRQQTIARIEGSSRSVALGEAKALAEATGSYLESLIRPKGLLQEAWRILDAAKRVRDSRVALGNYDSAVRHLEKQIARAIDAGLEEKLADEIAIGRYALDPGRRARSWPKEEAPD